MSLIEWITRRPGFRSLEDSFAINRQSMLVGLKKAIVQQQERCDEVWLVAHFFDTFGVLQEFLGDAEIDYQIVDRNVDHPEAVDAGEARAGVVKLVLASLVTEPPAVKEPAGARKRKRASLAMIVCERHPHYSYDKRLFEAVKKINASITFGYVLSLEDIVVKQIVSPMTLLVMKQLGLDDQELIASHYLSRLLERRLIRDGVGYVGDQEAESAERWIELNTR